MVATTVRKNVRKLFDKRERFIQENPDLSRSFSQFLRDFENYKRFQQSVKETQERRDYLIFGASFQK